MSAYYGIEAIAKRMGVSTTTLKRWYRLRGFLMYARQLNRRRCWYTNDELIIRWEVAQCTAQRYRPREPQSAPPR